MSSERRLSALESAFLGLESSEVPFVYACLLEFERPLALAPLRAHLDRVLADLPRYREHVTRGRFRRPIWERDAFDIARHVHEIAVAAPGGTRELERLAAELLAIGVPEGAAPWRMWTVHGLEGGRGALIAVVHHSLVDGLAGVRLLDHVLGAAEREQPQITTRPKRPLLTWKNAAALARLLRQGLSPASHVGLNPRHTGGVRAVASYALPLDDIHAVERAFEVTANDVVLAAVGGALNRFLGRRGFEPRELADVRAMVPVGRHGDGRAVSGNKVVLLLVPLPLVAADPVERLLKVTSVTRGLKSGHTIGGGDLLVALSDATTPALLTNVLRLALRVRAFNLIVTNVPGPREPRSLLGARLTRMIPIVNLWPHQALGIAVASYAGTLGFGFQSDVAVLGERDLHELRDDLADELAELSAAARREHAA